MSQSVRRKVSGLRWKSKTFLGRPTSSVVIIRSEICGLLKVSIMFGANLEITDLL